MTIVHKPSVNHDGSSSPLSPDPTQQLENLLQQTVQTLTEQLQAMQALCRNQDEHLQVRQEIQDLIDDWTDAQEAQLAWEEYDMTGVDGTLSYDEYREKRLGTETVV